MRDRAKVLLAQPEQRGAVEFRVAADVVLRVRMERAAILVLPHVLRVILRLHVDRARTPVVLLAGHVIPALDEQDLLARRRKLVHERTAARAGADDDHVVMRHAGLSMKPHLKMQRALDGWWSLAQRTRRRPQRRTYSSAASSMPSGGAVK